MTRKFITIESADVDSRHQLRSALEENILKRYGKKVMVIGTEYFPYDSFASNIEDAVVKAANGGDISQYTVLFSNIAILSSINDKISKALNDDIPVICVGHLTQFTVQALTRETTGLFAPIADCGLFVEPSKMIHLVHDEEKWELLKKKPENEGDANVIDFYERVNASFAQTAKNLDSIEELNGMTKTIYFENSQNIMDDILAEIDAVLRGPEPQPIVADEPKVANEEASGELEAMDEGDIDFEEQ